MNRRYRFIICLAVAVALIFSLKISPARAETTAIDFFKSGVNHMQRGNYQQAIQDFATSIELKSDFALAYSDRCLAYLQVAEYHKAIADCTEAIKLDPVNAEAYLNRGLAHHRNGNYAAAIADCSLVLKIKPYDFRAYYNRGIARAMLGDQPKAISDYNIALTQIPHTQNLLVADIYNDRGLAHFELSNLESATLDFNKAIRLNNNDPRAYFNRGCVCFHQGDTRSSVRDFSEAIRLDPGNIQAYINRGIAQHRLGYHQAAIADLQKAADYYVYQGNQIAHSHVLKLIKSVQQNLRNTTTIAIV